MSSIVERIKLYLKNDPEFQVLQDVCETTPLIDSGILDSFSVVKLMMFIEKEFGIKIEVEDLAEENIASLKSIEALILRKQKK